jgi:hypothetical protein
MRLDRLSLRSPLLLALLAALLTAPFLTACHPTTTNATMLAPSLIAVKLDIQVDGRRVPTTIEFRNTTQEKAFLYAPNACANAHIEKNVFKVEGDLGPIEYSGPYMKLAAPTAADFIELAPAATFVAHVNLEESYAFPVGWGRYRVRYAAVNPSPTPGELRDLQSEVVTFELR